MSLKTSGLMFAAPLDREVVDQTKGGTLRDMSLSKYSPIRAAHEAGHLVAAKTNYGAETTLGHL